MAPATVELDTLDSSRHSQDANNTESPPQTTHDESTLPPVDSGKAAWLFLAACWAVEAFVFGFGFSFGVFQDFYTTHEPFAGSGDIAVIGTTTLGTLYMGTPFVLMLCRLLPRWARWFTLLGLFTSTLSMAMSSFCTTVPQLIGTQGLMFGIGGCFAYCPCVVYIDEWFAKRKGMAYGVMWSAAGTGGVVLPLVLQVLLNNLGFETATRIWAGIFFVATLPLSFFIKPRLPNSATTHISPFNVRHLMSKLFALHQLFNFVQATGYFLPGIYLPTYARRIFGASDFLSTLTIMLVNISATIGCVIMGWMTDKLKVTTCIAISALGTTVTVFVIWGLATSLPVLYVFCVFYGLFAGSWTSVYPGIMRDVAKKGENAGHSSADPVVVMGYLLLARGIGNIVSGPLSEALVEGEPWRGQVSAGYGSGYGALLVYSGVTALLSGTSFVLGHLGWL